MKKDIQNLSNNGWNSIDEATKQRLKALYPINILQDISNNGWNGIDEATKDTVRTIFNPDNLRDRAKIEFASDVLRQKLDAQKEKPITNFLFPKTLESKIDNESYAGQVGSAIKDVFSLPGRIVARGIAGPKEDLEEIKQEHPVTGFVSEFARDIVEDPLLPLSFGLGAVGAIPKVVKYAPLASKIISNPFVQAAGQGALNVFGESDKDKNVGDAIISFGIGAGPDLLMAGIGNRLTKYGKIAKSIDEIKNADESIGAKTKELSKIEKTQLDRGLATIPEVESLDDLAVAQEIGRRNDPEGSEQIASLQDEIEATSQSKKEKISELEKLKDPGKRESLLHAGIGAVIGNQLFPGAGGVLGGAAAGLIAPSIKSASKKVADKLTEGVGRIVQFGQAGIPVLTNEHIKALGRRALADLADGTRSRTDVMAYTRALESLRHNPNDQAARKIYNKYNGL